MLILRKLSSFWLHKCDIGGESRFPVNSGDYSMCVDTERSLVQSYICYWATHCSNIWSDIEERNLLALLITCTRATRYSNGLQIRRRHFVANGTVNSINSPGCYLSARYVRSVSHILNNSRNNDCSTIISFPQPDRSPDLPPIENFWDKLEWRLQLLRNTSELVCQLLPLCQNLLQEYTDNLINSLLKRMTAFIDVKCGFTIYWNSHSLLLLLVNKMFFSGFMKII